VEIAINEIVIDKDRRPLNTRKVAEIANSISKIGLLNPITIRQDDDSFKLVAGLHRLEACKALQWEAIPINFFEGDELDAELAEIDENLKRNDLYNP